MKQKGREKVGGGLIVLGGDGLAATTLVTGGIARSLRERGIGTGVFKPLSVGGKHRREGYVGADVEWLAHWSDVEQSLEEICPVTIGQPSYYLSGERYPMDDVVDAYERLRGRYRYVVVDGGSHWAERLDGKVSLLDLLGRWGAAVVVAVSSDGMAAQRVAMVERVLKECGLRAAGVVLTGHRADQSVLEMETLPRRLEETCGIPLLAVLAMGGGVLGMSEELEQSYDVLRRCDWERIIK